VAAGQNSHGNRKLQHNLQVHSACAVEIEDRESRAGTGVLTQEPEAGKHQIEERRAAPGLTSGKTMPVPLRGQNKNRSGRQYQNWDQKIVAAVERQDRPVPTKTKLEMLRSSTSKSGKQQHQQNAKNVFSVRDSNKITIEPRRSLSFLPHLIIEMKIQVLGSLLI
jgi:hypothetical protein